MKTVLILEDDVSILALLHVVLEQAGYSVLDATSLDQAFQCFEENDAQVDLLIADVVLPFGSGIRAALELQELLPNLRTILTSGYPSAMWNAQEAARLDEFPEESVVVLAKPFLPAELLDVVHRLIGVPLTVPSVRAAS